MIKKVAEAATLRMACPEELGGIYAEEEMAETSRRRQRKNQRAHSPNPSHRSDAGIEEAGYFADQPTQGDPEGPGDYTLRVGTVLKGKKLKNIPLAQLNSFVTWVDGEHDKPLHQEVLEDAEIVRNFLIDAQVKNERPAPREWWLEYARLGGEWQQRIFNGDNIEKGERVHVLEATPARLAAEELEVALKRISKPRDCGCVPCLGRCNTAEDLQIYIDGLKEIAQTALSKAKAGGAGG